MQRGEFPNVTNDLKSLDKSTITCDNIRNAIMQDLLGLHEAVIAIINIIRYIVLARELIGTS